MKRAWTSLLSLTIAATSLVSLNRVATATHSELRACTIIYYQHEEPGTPLCYGSVQFVADVGILGHSLALCALHETRSWVQNMFSEDGEEQVWRNLNVLATSPNLGVSFAELSFGSHTELELEVHVTDLAMHHGDSEEGRALTIRHAKLFFLAMVDTARRYSADGLLEITITFSGLPSQDGLLGTPLPTSTADAPLTADSPLILALETELSDVIRP